MDAEAGNSQLSQQHYNPNHQIEKHQREILEKLLQQISYAVKFALVN
jgi:hypothetical protein